MDKTVIDEAIESSRCMRCAAALDHAGVHGVGVRKATRHDLVRDQTVLFLIIDCTKCGFRNNLATVTRLDAAMEAVIWMHDKAAESSSHNGDIQDAENPCAGDQKSGAEIPECSGDPAPAHQQPSGCKPSRRRWQPRHPFSEREINSFLRLLAKTSMRRNTKSFRKFMKRLGVDIESTPK